MSPAADTVSEGRRRAMLRTAMGPAIAAALADPLVIEVMINPDGALNQVEGGIIHAASMTLKEQVTLDGDGITSLDWASYPILTFSEVPEISTELIHAPDEPTLGMGECTFGPTAAAIGNAVAHALGVRVREMPLTRERIAAALVR